MQYYVWNLSKIVQVQVGVFSRGDVIRAALAQRKAVMQQTLDKSGKEVPEAPRESLRGD